MLGMGLPWLIATIWEGDIYPPPTEENTGYYIEAGSLGYSVVVFTVLAITCIILIVARRFVVGGELGGSKNGRTLSCLFLIFLWILYIVLSTIKMNANWPSSNFGIEKEKVHRLSKCWSDRQIEFMQNSATPKVTSGAYAGKTLYEARNGIAECIAATIKLRKTKPDTPWGTTKTGTCDFGTLIK